MMKTPKTKRTTNKTTSKIAQQIYLKRAGVASGIYAKYADSGTVPTNLVTGGGIKPLTNQQQQQATQPKPLEAPKQPAAPVQPTQPAAKPIEPIPVGVAPPPVVPPPSAGTPPATNMATGKPITPGQPQPGTMTNDGQLRGVPANSPSLQPEPAPPAGQTHIENAANPAVPEPPPAQTHIAPDQNAHAGITTPEAVNPTGQAAGQTGGQSAGQTAPNTGNQAQNAGQPNGQTGGQSSGQTPTPAKQFNEQELAQFEQMQDPKQFGAAFEKMTPEQRLQVAPRWFAKWKTDPKNAAMIAGVNDLQSGDPQRANSPGAQQAKAFMAGLPTQLREQLASENFQKQMAANPDATPQQQAGFMRQAWDQASRSVQSMPWPAQLMMGLGLGAGLVGMFSSMFGEGGVESGLLGLLGIGAVGLIGANYGMFGNDARMMMGQGAVGLGRMMGMNIPDAKAFTPEGMEQAKADAMTSVMEAIGGNAEKKIPTGGWQGGIKKIEELRAPLDQLANTAETYGKDFAITTLMGAMNTNDPSAAQQKFDMLMKQRQDMMDPQYLRNQMGPLADLVEMQFGKYPGAATAQAAPPQ